MKYYTKEQLKQIEELGVIQHFNTVIDSDYKRGTTAHQNETLADIYDAATGGKVSRHFGCKTCIMNLYRNAGQLYRKTLEYNKQKQAEQLKKAREAKNKKPDVEMKDGIITINLDNHEQ